MHTATLPWTQVCSLVIIATLQLLFLEKERHSGSVWTCLAKEEEEIM